LTPNIIMAMKVTVRTVPVKKIAITIHISAAATGDSPPTCIMRLRKLRTGERSPVVRRGTLNSLC
jgi:hypothetical protein